MILLRSIPGFRACVLSYSILSYLVRGLILILILNHEARCGSRIALSGVESWASIR